VLAPGITREMKLKGSKRQSTKAKRSGQVDPLQIFRRTIHSKSSPRIGLGEARRCTPIELLPRIVADLGRQPIYRQFLAPTTFPASLADYTLKRRLAPLNAATELVWTASILRLFSKEISEFLSLRSEYCEAYLSGDYSASIRVLSAIESKSGVSLWLLRQKLQILQLAHGLKAQKDLLDTVLNTPGLSQFAAWITYYSSLRVEENVSFANMESQTADVIALPGLGDYLLVHVFPYDLTGVKDVGAAIACEEPNPIIDRYETFVSMLQVYAARQETFNIETMLIVLDQLHDIPDARLQNMRAIFSASYRPLTNGVLALADAYTEGRYAELAAGKGDNLELIARARALSSFPRGTPNGASVRDQILYLVQDVLTLSPDTSHSRSKLKKIALSCAGHPYSAQIFGFLEREHDHAIIPTYTNVDRLTAICGHLDDPWSAPIIAELNPGSAWFSEMQRIEVKSSAIKLRHALSNQDDSVLGELTATIPDYRLHAYAGHIEHKKQNYSRAIYHYKKMIESPIHYVRGIGKKYMFDSFYASEMYEDAMLLAVEAVLDRPAAADYFPLEGLARRCLEVGKLRQRMELAVLLHLTAKYVHPKWERELSDIYENVLSFAGVDSPSHLVRHVAQYGKLYLNYFLRYVCVPRILDDTTCFDSVDAVDTERIAVCQALLQLDPGNEAVYLAEIRSITRAKNVAHLLHKVQSSKIFVDESGIKQAVEPELKDAFVRYLELLKTPGLEYQAERLSKRIGEMLNSKGHPEFRDLKLPASEKEGLWNSMLSDVVHEFALNPAYGLDTHLSTSIRHGAFEGHLRSPFAVEELLCAAKDGEHILPHGWNRRLSDISTREMELVRKHLSKFTQKFDEIVGGYLKNKLHIRLVNDNPEAMFDFHSMEKSSRSLMEGVSQSTEYDFFVDKLVMQCWEVTNQSLANIRSDLTGLLSKQVSTALDNLEANLSLDVKHDRVTSLHDAIARARVTFQGALHDVIGWFYKPTDLSRDPFDLDVAVHVALAQIENCYTSTPLIPTLDLAVPGKLDGVFLDGLCELLFILLQNVIIHGARPDGEMYVHLRAKWIEGGIEIEARNQLPVTVDLTERRALAIEAMDRYRRDSALRMARLEGGSGLSKIWRIAEFDLHAEHSVSLAVNDQREFISIVVLKGVKPLLC